MRITGQSFIYWYEKIVKCIVDWKSQVLGYYVELYLYGRS